MSVTVMLSASGAWARESPPLSASADTISAAIASNRQIRSRPATFTMFARRIISNPPQCRNLPLLESPSPSHPQPMEVHLSGRRTIFPPPRPSRPSERSAADAWADRGRLSAVVLGRARPREPSLVMNRPWYGPARLVRQTDVRGRDMRTRCGLYGSGMIEDKKAIVKRLRVIQDR